MKFSQLPFQQQPAATTTLALSKALKRCQQENAYLKRQLMLYRALLVAKAKTIDQLRSAK